MKPYVSIIKLELGANMDNMKAMVPMILPQIHAARHPNLFEKALTTGPARKRNKVCF